MTKMIKVKLKTHNRLMRIKAIMPVKSLDQLINNALEYLEQYGSVEGGNIGFLLQKQRRNHETN